MEMLSRGKDLETEQFDFTCKDMPYFRKLMVWEIGEKKLVER